MRYKTEDKYYLTKGSKKVVGWSLKLLLIIILFGISGKIFSNKIWSASFPVYRYIQEMKSELPGGTSDLIFNNPQDNNWSEQSQDINLLNEVKKILK